MNTHTKQELIDSLKELYKSLGRIPAKKDVPEDIRGQYKEVFGKWCYALEEAGIRKPSQRTLERRKRHKDKKQKRDNDKVKKRNDNQ